MPPEWADAGHRRRCRGGRAVLRGPAGRGRVRGRRARARPAAGDDVRCRRRRLVPVPRRPARPGRAVVPDDVRRAGAARQGGELGPAAIRRRVPAGEVAGPVVGGRRTRPAPGDTAARHALPNSADVVVNCTGLGARRMAGDDSLVPVRGQIVRVRQPGLREWLIADRGPNDLTYVVPRKDDVVVGGTSQTGDWTLTPDPRTAKSILTRAAALVPQLAKAEVLGHRVGLRPSRPAVRCDASETDGHLLVHCYGHGGAGVTLSWGCADEVLDLVSAAV